MNVNFVIAQDEADLERSPTENADSEDGFTAEIVTSTRYIDEVHPDRIVLLPGYALRLLKQGDLTPKEMSLWVGFRQAVYRQWRQGDGTVRNIPHWEVGSRLDRQANSPMAMAESIPCWLVSAW